MSALKEFANFITLNMANLAETYAQLLADGDQGYEALPVTQRTASARRLLKAVSETFETETSASVCQLFAESAGEGPQRWAKNVIPPHPLFEIECLGQTLVPVVTNLEASKFLWQVLSEVRNAASLPTPETPPVPAAPSPLDRLSPPPPVAEPLIEKIEKEDTLLSPPPSTVTAESAPPVIEPPVEKEDNSPFPSIPAAEIESMPPVVESSPEKEDTPSLTPETVAVESLSEPAVVPSPEKVETQTTVVHPVELPAEETMTSVEEDLEHEAEVVESRTRNLLATSGEAVMLLDEKGFIDCNEATLTIFGYTSKEQFINTHPSEQSPPQQPDGQDSRVAADERIATAYREGSHRFEWLHCRADGTPFPAEVLLNVVAFEGRQILQAIVRDISKYKLAEQAIKESEEKYKALINGIRDTVMVIDFDGNFVDMNSAAVEILEYSREELLSMGPVDIDSKLDAGDIKNLIKTLPSDQAQVFETIHTTKSGKSIPVEIHSSIIKYQSQNAILSIGRDLTDRKRAEEMLSKRANELETVADVGTVISTILDARQLLQTVVDLTKKRFDLYHAHIYLLDQNGAMLDLAAGAGEIGRQMVAEGWQIALEREQSLVAQAARMRKGVVVNNVRKNTGWLPNPLLPDTRSELAVPLFVGEQLLGVLDVQASEIDRFSEEDIQTHTVLATQVAIALQNANSFEETKHVLAEAEMLAREQTVLNELGQALASYLDVQQVLEEAYQQASRLIDTTNFYIGLFDEQKYEIKFPLVVSNSEIDRNITVIAADQGLAGYILHSRTSVLLEDNVRERQEAMGIKMVGEEPLSWLGVPLIFGDQVLGVMIVQSHTTPRLYDEHSRELLNAIGSQVAIALYNATLFESVAEAQQSAEARLQETIILQQLTQALAGTLVVNDVVDAFFQACQDFLEVDFSIFSLVDRIQQRVYAMAGFNVSDEHLRLANHALDANDIMADVIRTGETEIITGWDPRFDPETFQMEQMESWGMRIFMPITLRREHVGLVEVGFKEKTDVTVQETQVKLLRTLVDQTAIALESAQRYEASRRLAHREQTIRELTDKLRQAPTFEALTKTASEELSRILGVSHSVVQIGDSGNEVKSFSENQKLQSKNGSS